MAFYKLNIATLPDELYHNSIPVEDWLKHAEKAPNGFKKGELAKLSPVDCDVEIERIVGISLYMVGNVVPFIVPLLAMVSIVSTYAQYMLGGLLAYVAILWSIERFYFQDYFRKKYLQKGAKLSPGLMTDNPRDNQYVYTERNITKYLTINFVWPESLHLPKQAKKSLVFCIVPHGVGPMGVTAYPTWSKLWNGNLCHWTAAPAVMKLPLIGYYMSKMAYIPAKARAIHEVLTKKGSNVGIILDGIAGMFQVSDKEERAFLKKRKGIVKIALRAGASLVPVYGFGHTSLWTIAVDPFGIMEAMSNAMGVSVVPFFGRFGWFLGPPRRVPVTVCLGDPIECPQIDEPTNEQIDEYHKKLLDGYQAVFDLHKEAYGWGHKTLEFV